MHPIAYHERIQEKLRSELGAEILSLMIDPTVSEIYLNEDSNVWVESKEGKRLHSVLAPERALNLICTIASLSYKEVNHDQPDISHELDIMIDNHSYRFRFQGLIPPIVSNPIFSLRKPSPRLIALKEYVTGAMLNEDDYLKIRLAIESHANILIAGGTGSGKTTLLNAIIHEIATLFPHERFITIEDTYELQCYANDKVQLKSSETRSMNDLLRYSLRLRPDRIMIGEVRGQEAYSLLKAWNTGHPGGVATIHADSAKKALRRLAQLIEEAGVTPSLTVISDTIDVVIYISRDSKSPGGRKVQEVMYNPSSAP